MLAGAAWLSRLDLDGESYPQTAHENTQARAQYAQPQSEIGSMATDSGDRQNTASNPEDERQRAQADLEAQQDMALWAFWMVIVSAASVIIAIIAVILVRHTLEETEKTTAAAIEANRIARKSAERQLRAYVFVEESIRTRRSNNDPWVIETRVKNFGQTPAYSANALINHVIVDAAGSANVQLHEPTDIARFDLAPGQTFTIRHNMPALAGQMWTAFKAFQKVIFVYGRIDFTDAFSEERWITFRMFQGGGYVRNLLYDDKGNTTSESPA